MVIIFLPAPLLCFFFFFENSIILCRFNISPVAPPSVQYITTSKNLETSSPHSNFQNNNATIKLYKSPHITSHHGLPPNEIDNRSNGDEEERDGADEDSDDELDYDSDDSEPDHLNRDLSANDQFTDYWSQYDFALHGDLQNVLVSFSYLTCIIFFLSLPSLFSLNLSSTFSFALSDLKATSYSVWSAGIHFKGLDLT